MDYPPVAVVIITYQRKAILAETLGRLFAHLRYSGILGYVVADDGSDDGTHELVRKLDRTDLVITPRGGLGRNANAGLRAAFAETPYVLQLQDDLHLLAPLDLDAHVARLMTHEQDGYIRLWGVGGHRYTATLDESYWRVAWDSDELYIASDRPHLKHRRFHDAAGMYPEGLTTAVTEDRWCHDVKDVARERTVPAVLVPHSLDIERMWEHAGWHSRWREVGL